MTQFKRIKSLYFFVLSSIVLSGASFSCAADVLEFNDFTTFITQSGATSATGELPNLGPIPGDAVGSQTLGSATFTISAPSSRFFIGSYSPIIPGNEIAISNSENLNVDFANPVYSFGFYFAEPTDLNACGGGAPQPCVDSDFQVLLKNNADIVATINFNAPDDVLNFLGVISDAPFNRVEIKDLTGNIDNEYFGEFFSSTQPPVTYQLDVVNAGGGQVQGEGIDCLSDCNDDYFNSELVVLTAIPDQGYQLAGWENCDSPVGLQCTMMMNDNKTVTANFSLILYNLNVSVVGEGDVSGVGIACPSDCDEPFIAGQNTILIATERQGSTFRNWFNCDQPNGNECVMAMDRDKNVVANFASLSGDPVISQKSNTNPNAIPTLSEWALMLLATLLAAIVAIRYIRVK